MYGCLTLPWLCKLTLSSLFYCYACDFPTSFTEIVPLLAECILQLAAIVPIVFHIHLSLFLSGHSLSNSKSIMLHCMIQCTEF